MAATVWGTAVVGRQLWALRRAQRAPIAGLVGAATKEEVVGVYRRSTVVLLRFDDRHRLLRARLPSGYASPNASIVSVRGWSRVEVRALRRTLLGRPAGPYLLTTLDHHATRMIVMGRPLRQDGRHPAS